MTESMTRRGKIRRLHSRRRSKSAPPVFIRHSPVKRRKQWTNVQMEKAMEAVMSGVGISRAAMECGVPQTTLKDRISGRVEHGVNSGPAPYLNKEEEKELAVFLKRSASMGYGKTRKQVMATVQAYVTNNKKGLRGSKITQGWWRKFLARQKDLSLIEGDNTSTTTASKPPEFTDEQEQLYQKRYDEGYNLTVDSEYLQWLKLHHPESSLVSDSLSESIEEEEISLSAYFSDIAPLEAIEMQGLQLNGICNKQ